MHELPSTYDLVFFRNAFIYFSEQSRKRVLSNLSAALKKGALLILGVSETAGVNHSDFESKNTDDVFYFQKG
jgi:chemotaxis methyl-accepting protein methylase